MRPGFATVVQHMLYLAAATAACLLHRFLPHIADDAVCLQPLTSLMSGVLVLWHMPCRMLCQCRWAAVWRARSCPN
jgi:hypothetical protein